MVETAIGAIANAVAGNTAADFGGGIEDLEVPGLRLINSTVSRNTAPFGSAIYGRLSVTGSVISGDCDGDVASTGYNIESPGNACGLDQLTDLVNVSADDLKLGPLQDNGGPTMTHALLPGSVAIDHIPAIDCEVDEDQRGEPRPGGTMCDVGAFPGAAAGLVRPAKKNEGLCGPTLGGSPVRLWRPDASADAFPERIEHREHRADLRKLPIHIGDL